MWGRPWKEQVGGGYQELDSGHGMYEKLIRCPVGDMK